MKTKVTSKTKSQILESEKKDLTFEEKMIQSAMKRFDMSLEEAIESLKILP